MGSGGGKGSKLIGHHVFDCDAKEEGNLMKWKHVLEEEGMDLYSSEQNKEIFLGFYREELGLAIVRFNNNKFSFEICDNYKFEKRKFARKKTKA